MSKPCAMTSEELRDWFIRIMKANVEYWLRRPGKCSERLDGLAFSFLELLDGCYGAPCAFDLVARSSPEAKQYAIENGDETYVEDGTVASDGFHECWYQP